MAVAILEVPFVDLKVQTDELRDRVPRVRSMRSPRAVPTRWGRNCLEFERAFAQYCHAAHCVGVSSGTDAVKLALLGAGVGPGDDVLLPVNTFIATAEAVSHLGGRPVFVDCLRRYGRDRCDQGCGLRDARDQGAGAGTSLRAAGGVGRREGGGGPPWSGGGGGCLPGAWCTLQRAALRFAGCGRRLQLLPRQEPGSAR